MRAEASDAGRQTADVHNAMLRRAIAQSRTPVLQDRGKISNTMQNHSKELPEASGLHDEVADYSGRKATDPGGLTKNDACARHLACRSQRLPGEVFGGGPS